MVVHESGGMPADVGKVQLNSCTDEELFRCRVVQSRSCYGSGRVSADAQSDDIYTLGLVDVPSLQSQHRSYGDASADKRGCVWSLVV